MTTTNSPARETAVLLQESRGRSPLAGAWDLEVERKDKRAVQWCRDATQLSGQSWQYFKVKEDVFRPRQWRSLAELASGTADA